MFLLLVEDGAGSLDLPGRLYRTKPASLALFADVGNKQLRGGTVRAPYLWVAIVLVLLGFLAFGIYAVRRGFSAREQPTVIEAWLAKRVRNAAIPAAAKQAQNSMPATEENVRAGMAHWADHCAICHANNGSGNAEIGMNLYPKAPDMRLPETQHLTDGDLYYIIQNGVRLTGMPAWGEPGDRDGNQDSWKLVLFIRHLPHLTAEEEQEMEKLNPRSPQDLQEEREEQEFLNGTEPHPPVHHHDR